MFSRKVSLTGVAINHDGRAATITAPNGTAQQRVLRSALAERQTMGEDVTMIECHGTGDGRKFSHPPNWLGLDDWKLSGWLLAPIFWLVKLIPSFVCFGSISQTNWGCHKLPNIHPFHCQAQPWEILLRSVLNVLFMAKALRWVGTTGVTKFWDLIWLESWNLYIVV